MSAEQQDTLELSSNLGIGDAAELGERMSRLLDSSETITVQAAELGSVDTAIMQLLAAFWFEAPRRNRRVVWGEVSDSLRDAARLLGLAEVLELA